VKKIFAVIVKSTILLVLLASVGFIIYSLIFGEGEFNLRPKAPSFSGMTVTYDGEYHTLRIPVSHLSYWKDQLNIIRFDFFEAALEGDCMDIRSTSLVE